MLPTFESLTVGRVNLLSLLPDVVYCYQLDSSHPAIRDKYEDCENYYRTNSGTPDVPRVPWRRSLTPHTRCPAGRELHQPLAVHSPSCFLLSLSISAVRHPHKGRPSQSIVMQHHTARPQRPTPPPSRPTAVHSWRTLPKIERSKNRSGSYSTLSRPCSRIRLVAQKVSAMRQSPVQPGAGQNGGPMDPSGGWESTLGVSTSMVASCEGVRRR